MRRMSNLFLVAGCLIILFGCGTSAKKELPVTQKNDSIPVSPSKLLNVNEFELKLSSTPNGQIVDVRTPEEYDKGHIEGSVNINYQGNNFTADIEKLDKLKPTFVYCQSGGRSAESCSYMANHGFKELYELKNGFSSWTHYNKPVESKE